MKLLSPTLMISASIGLLMLVTISTQSQTLSSLVQPNATLHQVDDLQAVPDSLAGLIRKMDQRIAQDQKDYEAQLLKSIMLFQSGQPALARTEIEKLTQRAPKFHLAHLFRADLIASSSNAISDIGRLGVFSADNKHHQALEALRQEARMRIKANLLPSQEDRVPLQLLHLSHNVKTALLVDKSQHRLYIYERQGPNQPPRLVQDYYVSTGRKTGNKLLEGDLRTPEGVYFITSWIPDNNLPDKYGVGAFPTNYPNVLDRKLGKTGNGIWLHGTDPIYYSRPPLDSEGCVVLSNIDLSRIRHLIKPGTTPFVIADRVEWVDRAHWQMARAELLKALNTWRRDWESRNVNKYLSHYSDEFWSSKHNFRSWRQYKSGVIRRKTYQKIDLSDISLFYYPRQASSGKQMVLAKFRQHYQSNNFNSDSNKRLYLSRQQDKWKIIYEGR